MSKIICDVCGTSYPETATQCPICGCVRPGDAKVVAGNTNEPEVQTSGTYTYVKGGRFSKSNVKKRSRSQVAGVNTPAAQPVEKKTGGNKNEVGVVIAILALLLAIVAVVIYIAMRFFAPALPQTGNKPSNAATTGNSATMDPTGTTGEPTTLEIPCTAITVSKTVVEFDKAGAALLLNVTTNPENTTDVLKFTSSDENVATVSQDGKITAVGGGEAVIAITCGQATAECKVVCDIEHTQSTETTAAPTISADGFKLNREDFTLVKKGESHILYKGEIPVESITWTTEDANVATVENGKVVAVGSGVTTVHAEYGGVKCSCIVRCAPSVGKAQTNNTENQDQPVNTPYNISSTDVTIAVNEEFKLQLLDSNKAAVSVVWVVGNGEICSVSDNTVKGLKSGMTTVSVVYEGVTYSCTVRVKG